jgi:hypothetical protein
LIKDGPNLEAFAEFPATAVEHGAATIQLRRFALIAGAFREVIESLFAGNFQPYCFKRCIHELARCQLSVLGLGP